MNDIPKLSKNFNAKFLSEVRRKLFYKNISNIVLSGFFKGFVSVFDVFFSWVSNKDDQNKK